MVFFDYGNFSATRGPAVYRLGPSLSTTVQKRGRAGRRARGAAGRMSSGTRDAAAKPVVLVGLMGAGKTSVGRKLAETLDLPFVDADEEIAEAAGCSIDDIFELYGEAAFRDVEERVIHRLLDQGPQVLATGGGAFMNPKTRALIAEHAVSVWLRAGLDVLVRRTRRRGGRPLLKTDDPEATLRMLMDERYPIYAEADVVIDSDDEGPEVTARSITEALAALPESAGQETSA